MDSLLSLHTPTTTPHPPPPTTPPGIPIPFAATSAAPSAAPGASAPDLLTPKPEPFDDFLASQDPQWSHHHHHHPPTGDNDDDEEPDLYSEFFRVSQLFRVAFGKTLQQQFGDVQFILPNANNLQFGDVKVSENPDSEFEDVKVLVPAPNSNFGGAKTSVSVPDPNFGDSKVSAPNSQPGEADGVVADPNSRAIVPVPAQTQDPSAMAVAVARTPRRHSRKKELVRVLDLSVKDQLHFRRVVRTTRMVYESLRVLTTMEEEKRVIAAAAAAVAAPPPPPPPPAPADGAGEAGAANGGVGIARRGRVRVRLRGDLRAASLMRERGLWLNREKRVVGAIPGIFVGDLFLFRMELCVLGLHGQIQAGIDYLPASMSSNGEPIATSVIVSGGYEDDLDDGEVIIYTGQGGQLKNSSRQASHQKLEGGNLALERSMHYGIEVRVIRGVRYEGSASSSGKIYVYDGLYRIVDCWFDVGKSGFGVYKYKLWRMDGQAKMGSAILKEARDIRRNGLDFKPMYCLSVDMSNGKENAPVRLFNDIDDNQDPLCFEYLPKTSFPPFVFHQTGKATGCDCVNGCVDGCFCCMKNGGEFPYNQNGILVRGKPLVFECGPFCSCPPHCRNRVSQKGVKNRLELFRSRQTGWGVRSLDLIHAGAFICEYAGVVLTREQAQILTMNGDSLIYPNRFSDRWAEWGDLSQVFPNYVRPSYPSIPPLDYSLDVSRMRNVACYLSQSSTPNVFIQFVLYDHNNLMFPHLMLFAMENIPPLRELSLDYGVPDEWTGKLSICN